MKDLNRKCLFKIYMRLFEPLRNPPTISARKSEPNPIAS